MCVSICISYHVSYSQGILNLSPCLICIYHLLMISTCEDSGPGGLWGYRSHSEPEERETPVRLSDEWVRRQIALLTSYRPWKHADNVRRGVQTETHTDTIGAMERNVRLHRKKETNSIWWSSRYNRITIEKLTLKGQFFFYLWFSQILIGKRNNKYTRFSTDVSLANGNQTEGNAKDWFTLAWQVKHTVHHKFYIFELIS